jgi:GAF domain-containing protein
MSDVASRLVFLKNLQGVTNKIHATSNVDEIMLELSQDICKLFNADRITIYLMSEDQQSIVSKVKAGLNSFKDIKLPVSDQSIAGFVALNRRVLNLNDVYDEAELRQHSPKMQFLKEVDKRTGYRCKQMLVAPIIAGEGDLLGVVQLINHKTDKPFPVIAEEGIGELGETLAIALIQRQKAGFAIRSRYDHLVADGLISAGEMEAAQLSAREQERFRLPPTTSWSSW